MRTQLSNGTVIPLLGKEYRILNVIGDGASCIVYDVCTTNQFEITRHYRLKECYPYHAKCHREGLQLVWDDETQRQSAFERFTKSAKMIADLRDEESIGNHITGTELAEGNGTLYALMEVNHAQTYQQDQTQDLHRILQTMLKLTQIVGRLHEQGYLHLDIKPENFLVNYDPDPNIWLFDVDSLVAQADLHNGRTACYSYSREWAAPELTQGKLNKVCFATDLFSIGAILFDKVMGRPVCNDDIGLFPEWDFEGSLFDDPNPKVTNLLETIFRHTLSASVKCRYQTAEKLEAILADAVEATSGVPYLQTENITATAFFTGREAELEKIRSAFTEGKRLVYLHGFGGIGKTELARKFVQSAVRSYDVVRFVQYGMEYDSIDDWTQNVQIENFDGTGKEKRKKLLPLLNNRTLIIIDNFDVEIGEDNGLEYLLKSDANFVVTTRTDFTSVLHDCAKQIEIGPLPDHELETIFTAHSHIIIHDGNRPVFQKLCKLVENHTYYVSILAGIALKSVDSLDGLYKRSREGILSSDDGIKIVTMKDGEMRKHTSSQILRGLFRLSDLTEQHKAVLRNVYLLSKVLKLSQKSYQKFVTYTVTEVEEYDRDEECWRYSFDVQPGRSAAHINALNDLVERNLVKYKWEMEYSLHPLVAELVAADLTPDESNCKEIYGYVKRAIKACTIPFERDEVDEAVFDRHCVWLCYFFLRSDFSSPVNLNLCLEWLLQVCHSSDRSAMRSPYKKLYAKLLGWVSAGQTNSKDEYRIRYILLSCNIAECRWRYRSDDADERNNTRMQAVSETIAEVQKAVSRLSADMQDSALRSLYVRLDDAINDWSSEPILPSDQVIQLAEKFPEFIHISTEAKEIYHIPLSPQEQAEKDAQRALWDADPEMQEWRDNDEYNEWLKSEFLQSDDKLGFICDIISNDEFSTYSKIDDLHLCMRSLFESVLLFRHYNPQFFEGIGWATILKMLNREQDFLEHGNEHEGWQIWKQSCQYNTLCHLITSAALGDAVMFDEYMGKITSELAHKYSKKYHWSAIAYDLTSVSSFSGLVHGLCEMDKLSFVLPHLIKMAEQLEAYARTFEDFEERNLYVLYQEVANCASRAAYENNISKELSRKYDDISYDYDKKCDTITGMDYWLNFED